MNIIKARQELMLGKTIYDMDLKIAVYYRVSRDTDEQETTFENKRNYFIDDVKNWIHVASYSDGEISDKQIYKGEEFLRMIEDAKLREMDLYDNINPFGSNSKLRLMPMETMAKADNCKLSKIRFGNR